MISLNSFYFLLFAHPFHHLFIFYNLKFTKIGNKTIERKKKNYTHTKQNKNKVFSLFAYFFLSFSIN